MAAGLEVEGSQRDGTSRRCGEADGDRPPHVIVVHGQRRPDLHEDEIAVARAFVDVLAGELLEVVDAGCDYIQFDEPVLTLSPDEVGWAADVLNEFIDKLPSHVRIGLHICGGNPHRKRVYFGKYTDMTEGLTKLKIDEISHEY